jgi:hypothetical protein
MYFSHLLDGAAATDALSLLLRCLQPTVLLCLLIY